MSFGRLSVVGLSLVAEATWVAVTLELVSWGVAQTSAIVPFWAVLIVVTAGWSTGRFAPTYAHEDGDELSGPWRWRQALFGAGAMIFGLAAGGASGPGFTPAWPVYLLRGDLSGGDVLALAVGAGMCLLSWRRGIALALEGPTAERLNTLFLVGLMVVLLSAVADAACGCGLLSPWLAGTFFATSLAALALAQLPTGDRRTGDWTRVVAIALAVVLGGALVLGHLGAAVGGEVAAAAGQVWRSLVEVVITGISVVLGPVLEFVFDLLARLKGLFSDHDVTIDLPRGPIVSSRLREGLSDEGSALRHLVELGLLAGLCLLLYRGFMLGFRSRFRLSGAASGDAREQIGNDSTALEDIKDLFLGLLPEWIRQREPGRPPWPATPPDPMLARTFALYFRMLDLALDGGWELDLTRTPSERVEAVRAVLPDAPVESITACFNAACYAGRPPPSAEIDQLARQLEAGEPTA